MKKKKETKLKPTGLDRDARQRDARQRLFFQESRGTQVRTIEGSTDNETLVKITRQQKKVGRQEQEVKMQKIQMNQERLKQSGRNPDLLVMTF